MTWLVFNRQSPTSPIGRLTAGHYAEAEEEARNRWGADAVVFTRRQHRDDVHRRLLFELAGCKRCESLLCRTGGWAAQQPWRRRLWWGLARATLWRHRRHRRHRTATAV